VPFTPIYYFSRSFPGHPTPKCLDSFKSWEVLTRQIYTYIDINIDTGQDSVYMKLRMDAVNCRSQLLEFATALALYGCQWAHLCQDLEGLTTCVQNSPFNLGSDQV